MNQKSIGIVIVIALLHLPPTTHAWQIWDGTDSNDTVHSADALERLLDTAWIAAKSQTSPKTIGLLITWQLVPATNELQIGYECEGGFTIRDQYSPWDQEAPPQTRRSLASAAQVIKRHPARALIDHVVIAWTGKEEAFEWRFPTRVQSQCIQSQAAQQSLAVWRRTQQVTENAEELWYQASLMDLGRRHLQAAQAHLGPLGIRRMVKLPAYPYLNPHWAWVAGLQNSHNDSTALYKMLQICKDTDTDIWLPGIDSTPQQPWADAVESALALHIPTVWTSAIKPDLITSQDQWLEIGAYMGGNNIGAFVTSSLSETTLAAQYIAQFQQRFASWYLPRHWNRVALLVATLPGSPEATWHPLNHWLPVQVQLPGHIHLPPGWWEQHYNLRFLLTPTWSAGLYPLPTPLTLDTISALGCTTLPSGVDSARTWWAWTGLIDCEFTLGQSIVSAAVNSSTLGDVFDLVVCDVASFSPGTVRPLVIDLVTHRFAAC